MSDDNISSILAFFLPFICGFVAEADDKSQSTMIPVEHSKLLVVAGMMLGLIPAVLTAIFGGFVMERSFSDDKVVFGVMSINCCFFIIMLSQALMHMSVLEHARGIAASLVQFIV